MKPSEQVGRWRALLELGEQLLAQPTLAAQRDIILDVATSLVGGQADLWLSDSLCRLPDRLGSLQLTATPSNYLMLQALEIRATTSSTDEQEPAIAVPLLVNSDPRLLEQVFVNLIANAIHALLEKEQDDRRIEIGTLRKDSQVEIRVEDNADGIPKEAQGKIFELFYTTKPPGKGTGLGLPISKNVVRNLGGELTFKSKVGVGTTFLVRIPVS